MLCRNDLDVPFRGLFHVVGNTPNVRCKKIIIQQNEDATFITYSCNTKSCTFDKNWKTAITCTLK